MAGALRKKKPKITDWSGFKEDLDPVTKTLFVAHAKYVIFHLQKQNKRSGGTIIGKYIQVNSY